MSSAEITSLIAAFTALVAAVGAIYKVRSDHKQSARKDEQDALKALVEHLQHDIEMLQASDSAKSKQIDAQRERIKQLEDERADWVAEREHMREEIRLLRQALAAHNIAVPELPARNHRRRRDVLA